jgi:hypothetical protein
MVPVCLLQLRCNPLQSLSLGNGTSTAAIAIHISHFACTSCNRCNQSFGRLPAAAFAPNAILYHRYRLMTNLAIACLRNGTGQAAAIAAAAIHTRSWYLAFASPAKWYRVNLLQPLVRLLSKLFTAPMSVPDNKFERCAVPGILCHHSFEMVIPGIILLQYRWRCSHSLSTNYTIALQLLVILCCL